MSQYRAYPAYKDSGIEWIGQVPEHWKIAPVKYHYDARLGKMIQPAAVSDRDIEVPYHRAQTVQWERIVESDIKEMWASPRDIEQFSVSEGDLLICEGGDVCRAAIVKQPPEKNMIFQNSIHRIRSKGEYGVGWVMRLMQHLRSSEWIDVLCNKNTIVHFTSDKLGSLECPLPPPEEQASIAATLDRETARIDALVEKKTRFIELLKEKRQALITHAVTKGLDPNAKMKDSGIEWIGEVPEHWEVKPFFALVTELNRKNVGLVETNILSLSYGNIIQKPETRNMGLTPESYETYQIVESGEIVFRFTDLQNDKRSLRSAQVTQRGIITSAYMAVKPQSIDSTYFAWLMRSYDLCKVFYAMGGGLRQSLKFEDARRLPVLIPPVDEQSAITNTINAGTARIDALVEKTEQSITLLKERRAAFITAAVTGQIDLRGKQ